MSLFPASSDVPPDPVTSAPVTEIWWASVRGLGAETFAIDVHADRTWRTPALDVHSYLWFGDTPGQPLPDPREMKIAKHAKANAAGVKLERPNQRVIPRRAFTRIESMDGVLERLFGPLP